MNHKDLVKALKPMAKQIVSLQKKVAAAASKADKAREKLDARARDEKLPQEKRDAATTACLAHSEHSRGLTEVGDALALANNALATIAGTPMIDGDAYTLDDIDGCGEILANSEKSVAKL